MSLEQEVARLKAEIEACRAREQAVPAVLAEVDYARRRIAWLERERDALSEQLHTGAEQIRQLAAFARGGGPAPAWPAQAPAPEAVRALDWQGFQSRAFAPGKQVAGIWIQEASIDWSHALWQRPQHMALAMARRGWLVVYRTCNASHDRVSGWREIRPNLWLTDDPATDAIEGAVRSVYNTSFGEPLHTLSLRPRGTRFVFEVVDHLDERILGSAERVQLQQALQDWALLGGAELVVATARVLLAQASAVAGSERCVLVPNGVDLDHYLDPAALSAPVEPRLAAFRARHSRLVGYFGALAPWLDYAAITRLVESRPDLGFVFIGPDYQGGASRLPVADNVLATGPLDYDVLPAQARLFDACLIPFEPGEVARTTSPLKLFEYFALGKPVVVADDMAECVAFPEVFHGEGAEGLSRAIDAALEAAQSPGFADRMRALAAANSWDARAADLEQALTRRAAGLAAQEAP